MKPVTIAFILVVLATFASGLPQPEMKCVALSPAPKDPFGLIAFWKCILNAFKGNPLENWTGISNCLHVLVQIFVDHNLPVVNKNGYEGNLGFSVKKMLGPINNIKAGFPDPGVLAANLPSIRQYLDMTLFLMIPPFDPRYAVVQKAADPLFAAIKANPLVILPLTNDNPVIVFLNTLVSAGDQKL